MQYYKLILLLIFFSCNNKVLNIDLNDPNLLVDNGVLLFKTKPFSGHLIEFYKTQKIKSETQYLNGLKDGPEKYWYKSGAEASLRWYSKSKKINKHLGYWENGKIKFKYFFNQKGEYNGQVNEWFNSGSIYKSFNYENGMEVGAQKLWRADGSIRANYFVNNGERFGLIGLKKCEGVSSREINN